MPMNSTASRHQSIRKGMDSTMTAFKSLDKELDEIRSNNCNNFTKTVQTFIKSAKQQSETTIKVNKCNQITNKLNLNKESLNAEL